MTIGVSAVLAGLPPSGVGIYDPRGRRDGFAFRAVNPANAGARDWLFIGPGSTTPDQDEGAIATMERAAGPLTPGAIVDPEQGWPQLTGADRAAQFRSLGAGLRRLARRMRVIVTSHGGFPVAELAPHLRGVVIGSPQLYYDAPTNARVWARWRRVFGRRLLPSIAGPRGIANPPAEWATAEGYARYLDGIPRDVPGVIVWDLTEIRPDALAAIRARWGGVFAVPWVFASGLDTWGGLALLVLAALALAAMLAPASFLRGVL